jgi:hypothetical protein
MERTIVTVGFYPQISQMAQILNHEGTKDAKQTFSDFVVFVPSWLNMPYGFESVPSVKSVDRYESE